MARTVKIPDCSSTFEVFLNGAKHSFIGGTEVEVEDEIANLIEQHNKEHTPKEAPKTVGPFNSTFANVIIWDEDNHKLIVGGEESPEFEYDSAEDYYSIYNNELLAKLKDLAKRGAIVISKSFDNNNRLDEYKVLTDRPLAVRDDRVVMKNHNVYVKEEQV